MPKNKVSLVRYAGINVSDHCGYCKSTQYSNQEQSMENEKKSGPSVSFGLSAYRISVGDYLALLDRGWRRSGCYLYKPILEETCCPQYTIRLDVNRFKLSRTQKRVLKVFLDYLKNDVRPTKAVTNEIDVSKNCRKKQSLKNLNASTEEKSFATAFKTSKNRDIPFQKKKLQRRKRAEEKLLARGINLEEFKRHRQLKEESRVRTVESYLEAYVENVWKHKLDIHLVSLDSEEFKQTFDEEFNIYEKYQTIIHHDNDNSPSTFIRFLCSSPLFSDSEDEQNAVDLENSPPYGSYHQQYILDGKIIAVGVIDILERAVSSKYFFYDPEYKFLSLGTYSALREIVFTKHLALFRPQIHYYYMGFYLYDCPKMRYKGKFRPSDLLCDKTFQWVPLSESVKILEDNNGKFSPFALNSMAQSETPNINQIFCLFNNSEVLPFSQYRLLVWNPEEVEQKIKNFVKYAGPAAKNIILCP